MIWVVLGRIRASYKARVDGASVPESSEEELLEIGPPEPQSEHLVLEEACFTHTHKMYTLA